jgi:predicted PurR-regulated permease PerM
VELDLQRFYRVNRPILMWIVFFTGLFLLRQFFTLVFITFIFAFVMRNVAKFLTANTRAPYWAAVIFPYLAVLTLLVLLMVTAIPRVVDEGTEFSRKVPGLLEDLAKEVQKSAKYYGMEPMLAKYVNTAIESQPATQASVAASPNQVSIPALTKTLQEFALGLLPGMKTVEPRASFISLFDSFIGGVVSGTLKFLLAILLSFLIVLDFEAVGAELRKWRESQVGLFFHEAAASVVDFSRVVGRAFQCQLVVAVLNASITCVGMAILGIQPLLLLTTIVFLFGLIPVLGVFISSVPIILIAFNSPEGGLRLALIALGMIVVVHLLEAYVFNPRIYAARFHLNPVIVLIILLVAHELFGVWGMLLGIPVTTYVLNVAQLPALPPPKQRLRKRKGTSPSAM